MRRKLPPNRETQPGENQEDRWTYEMRLGAWAMFVDHRPGDGMWGRMEALVGKSVKACETEMWKMHASNPKNKDKETYWDKAGRLDIILQGREGMHWTHHENKIVDGAIRAGMPIARLAGLLGRSVDSISAQLSKRQKKNRPKMTEALKEMQTTNLDPDAEARTHPLFPAFVEWGLENGVSVEPDDHVDDWMPSWECFLAGVNAADKFPKVKE